MTWSELAIEKIYSSPFLDLVFRAQSEHKKQFDPNQIEQCSLLSIKTGSCPEDCAYCPQSGHYQTQIQKEKMLDENTVIEHALRAKENGAKRFCLGAAWRKPSQKDFSKVLSMIRSIKKIGLETCVTLGMLEKDQAKQLAEYGLDFYNHNLDTSADYYKKIITTRQYQDRLETLQLVRSAGIKVCCGGIMGMGESRADRIKLLQELANLPQPPESVPINRLIPIPGTPLEKVQPIDNFEFIRTIATARIIMPTAIIRLSAGRENMSEEMQAWCFMAGANSIWIGEKMLTVKNVEKDSDNQLFQKLGINAAPASVENLC